MELKPDNVTRTFTCANCNASRPLVKSGFTCANSQRFKCLSCGATVTPDKTNRLTTRQFELIAAGAKEGLGG